MKYEYQNDCIATKLLHANRVANLPTNLNINFDVMHVRFYKSEENKGFFYCQLAIPALTEEDDFVFEREFNNFSDLSRFELDDSDHGVYEAPILDLSGEVLSRSTQCSFEFKVIDGEENLLLVVAVKGTSFKGYVAFDKWFYKARDI